MRAVCQRVSRARLTVDGATVAETGRGLVVLLGVARGDTTAESDRLAGKVARLRVFEDEQGKFAHSLLDVGGAALVVSQFTLIADTRKGNRPSFAEAAPPDVAESLYERFAEQLAAAGVPVVERGRFGSRMEVELVSDGPVTIVLE
jgi:D-aminoacyl-tRNA deacylase